MTERVPDWDIDYQAGRQGEIYVRRIRESLQKGACEVKYDRLTNETGNLYIEYACFRRGEWRDSGIKTTKAPLYIFTFPGELFAIAVETETLKDLARHCRKAEEKDGSHPTRGVLVPLEWLVKKLIERSC